MAEAIHCPSCSTRYRLRPERLKPVIRRAQCFSCGGVFPVGDIVARLLVPPPAQGAAAAPTTEDVMVQHAFAPPLDTPSPSLTLGDLEGVDAEILEKTLIDIPTFLPETKAPIAPVLAAPETAVSEPAVPAPIFPPEITESTLSGYTSARDAIDKLFGTAPTPPSTPTGLKTNQNPNSMDMEATMSALESTLSGTQPTPPSVGSGTLGDSLTASGLTEEELEGPSSSTMRLSQADLLAAIASSPTPTPTEPTVALRASDLVTVRDARTEMLAPSSTRRSFAPPTDAPDAGAELLRLKIGEEIYNGLTMPQLTAWVEEGRILENHLVARQHSENWLEAHKVPGLRPVFEHLRRERSGGAPSLDSGFGDIAPKKSLFGGLFGKT